MTPVLGKTSWNAVPSPPPHYLLGKPISVLTTSPPGSPSYGTDALFDYIKFKSGPLCVMTAGTCITVSTQRMLNLEQVLVVSLLACLRAVVILYLIQTTRESLV